MYGYARISYPGSTLLYVKKKEKKKATRFEGMET